MSKVVMCLRWGELDSCDINPECAGLWESSSGFEDVPSILESKSCRELCTSSWNTGFWLGCGIE